MDQSPHRTCIRSTKWTRGGGEPDQGNSVAVTSWWTTTSLVGDNVRIRLVSASICLGRWWDRRR